MLLRTSKFFILISCLILHSVAFALSSDRHQAISVKADNVNLNEKTGISIYKGNVIFTQGSLIIKGDKVVIYQTNNKVSKIVVTGIPATFQQQQDNVNTLVKAKAGKMEFITNDERVYLSNNAFVSQGDNMLKGEQIEYNTHNSTVTANKGTNEKGRVHAVIEPDNNPINTPKNDIKPDKKIKSGKNTTK